MSDIIVNIGCAPGSAHPCDIMSQLERIDMKLSELATQLATIDAKLSEASIEIIDKIARLEATLADVDVPAEATTLIAEIGTKAASLADIVPNE
jgi:cob(I)alamin adenosyltransferase